MRAALLAALLLGGCAREPTLLWTKPGGTHAAFIKAKAECEWAAMTEYHCMQMRGYVLKADP